MIGQALQSLDNGDIIYQMRCHFNRDLLFIIWSAGEKFVPHIHSGESEILQWR